jgi:hypothetical protein
MDMARFSVRQRRAAEASGAEQSRADRKAVSLANAGTQRIGRLTPEKETSSPLRRAEERNEIGEPAAASTNKKIRGVFEILPRMR